MANFVSTSALLRKKYEENKDRVVKASPDPVSDICSRCWYQSLCIVKTLRREPPRTCCVFEFFGDMGTTEATVEDLVKFTCDTRCEQRRQWENDPCPHDENYCENYCPVSRYITDRGKAKLEDVPYEGFG